MNIQIYWCGPEELDWVNGQYGRLDFKLSSLDTDRIAIASIQGKRVGIGRLCSVESSVFELGGMYVESNFRGMGIARNIVRFLLEKRPPETTVYCLPFSHLQSFYEGEGFREASEDSLSRTPKEILDKHQWCNKTYPYKVLLLEILP